MPTKAGIERVFDIYNAVLFDGRLERPNIMVRRMNHCGRWYAPEPAYPRELLVISSSMLHRMTWLATLLHEMCHIAVPEIEIDPHGPLFTSECNRVGVLIGLEPCEVEESWNWPAHHLDYHDDEQNIMEDVTCARGSRNRSRSRRRLNA